MSKFEFIESGQLPGGKGGRSSDPLIVEFADALRDNPGIWAKWPRRIEDSRARTAIATAINSPQTNRRPRPFRTGRFAAINRGGGLFVRYIGERDDEAVTE